MTDLPMLIRFFSSIRLTLALLLGLALASVFGTLSRAPEARFYLYYQSPWFRLLLLLLALNLMVCTFRTLRSRLGDRAYWSRILESAASGPVPASLLDARALGLKGCGFGVHREPFGLLGIRGGLSRWGSSLVHLSVLLIMAGAWAGSLGFVGTLNIHVGDSSDSCFDWDLKGQRPLGFELRLDRFELLYYPIEVRFAVMDGRTGRELELHTSREGLEHPLPVQGYSVRVQRFLPEEKTLVLGIYREGRLLGEYASSATRKVVNPQSWGGLEFEVRGYRDPVMKQTRSEVSLIREGRVVRQGVIEVNSPLVFEGVSIYQTAFDRDRFGLRYVGFQFSRDPGEPLVWFGCLLLVAGLALAFFLPLRVVGLVGDEKGELRLVALAGFAGDRGREALESLEKRLAPRAE